MFSVRVRFPPPVIPYFGRWAMQLIPDYTSGNYGSPKRCNVPAPGREPVSCARPLGHKGQHMSSEAVSVWGEVDPLMFASIEEVV